MSGERVHVLERRQRLKLPVERVFEFYAQACNLETITPPCMGFEVITPGPIEMRPGALIDYRLKLHGVGLQELVAHLPCAQEFGAHANTSGELTDADSLGVRHAQRLASKQLLSIIYTKAVHSLEWRRPKPSMGQATAA